MRVTVNLYATFRSGRFEQELRDFPLGTMLREVVAAVGIAESEIGMSLVNGCHAPMERALRDGDSIYLFPLLGGG
ncbi:MAG: MoaD/ThiS family protein [Geobacteraceae bacterium]|nr:MoaD/ThiS family protein [Geobacteraceae bacterium]